MTAFAIAPDGRIVFSVRRLFKTKEFDLQRDDIWLQNEDGKRRRVVLGEKLVRGDAPFSYSVESFRWSPDGHKIIAALFTTAVIDADGNTRDQMMSLLLDDSGKELRIAAGDSIIPESFNAAWLADGATVVYLAEAVKPHLLFSLQTVRSAGRRTALFAGRTFVDIDWILRSDSAIAVERDRNLTGPPRIQRLDLANEIDTELATLDAYAGGLSISPSGSKAAYYLDREVLEIRDLAAPNAVARIRIGFGVFQWAPDEKRILLKRAPEKKSADLVWIDVPPLAEVAAAKAIPIHEPAFTPILHGLTFRDFQISPDGRFLAVVPPGKRNLLIYPLR